MQITEVFETASPRPADAGGAGAGIGEGNDSIVEAAASVEPARTASDPAQAAGAMGGRRRRNNMNASTAPTEVEVQSGDYATREDMLTHEQGFELGRISRLLSRGCTAYDILNVSQHTSFPYISIRFQWLSRLVHPYNCRGDARAATVFEAVRGSYEVLSDPQTRRQLDEAIIRRDEERRNAFLQRRAERQRREEQEKREHEQRMREIEERRKREFEQMDREQEQWKREDEQWMREHEQWMREHEQWMRQYEQ